MREILGKLGDDRRPDGGAQGGANRETGELGETSKTGETSETGESGEAGAEARREAGEELRAAALRYAGRWGWPVVPGVLTAPRGGCRCPRGLTCPVPGAHPDDPRLLAATRDLRMVRWWWTQRPAAPVLLATGGRAPCALSLPVPAAVWAVKELDRQGVRTGPVVAGPQRWAFLVRPYELPELGELLGEREEARGEWVPAALRFHGPGGYLPLPPSRLGGDRVRWARPPEAERDGVALPRAAWLLEVLLEAGSYLAVLSEQQQSPK